jgi:quinol monooxygenase YgiN
MIRRIVKMVFREEETNTFQQIFSESAPFIRQREGCTHLELWQDQNDSCTFFTFSLWEREEDLQAYRESELFANTWKKTKALFNDRPQAWSVQQVEVRP